MPSLVGKVKISSLRVVVASAKEIDRHPDQSILAVSHAGALMTFLHAVEPERAFESCPGNCAILVLITMDRAFTLSNLLIQ